GRRTRPRDRRDPSFVEPPGSSRNGSEGKAFERAAEAVGELAGRPLVQVTLGGGEPRVAHRRLHARQIDAAGNEQRAVGMPEVVEPQALKVGRVSSTLEATAKRGRVEPPPEAVGEHVVVGAGELDTAAEALKCGCSLVGEGDLAGSAALCGAELRVSRETSADDDLPSCEVDVAPAQRDQLA